MEPHSSDDSSPQDLDRPARGPLVARFEVAGIWLLAHGARVWPFLALAVILWLSWGAVRQFDTHGFRDVLHSLDPAWLALAAAVTVTNIAVMGLYDVIAFRHTRASAPDRWRFGAVAFAWSNFLTVGPVAGPAIRFWLYRPSVDHLSELNIGVLSVAVAFVSGLLGWTLAVVAGSRMGAGAMATSGLAFALVLTCVWIARWVVTRTRWFTAEANVRSAPAVQLALVGWLDWLFAALVFAACVRATGVTLPLERLGESFFLGQVVGLASLVPGGLGTSDLFWMAHFPLDRSAVAAALVAYRVVYYLTPWAVASLILLTWATTRSRRRLQIARLVVATLVGGGGVLIMVSSASPALHARLGALEQVIPLPLVEVGQVTAALAGLVLLVLGRGLARGYRAAFRGVLTVLVLAGIGAILKGLDWEEASILGLLAVAATSQAGLFTRRSRSDWLEGRDVLLAVTALLGFVIAGVLAHRVNPTTLQHWASIGYRLEGTRFIRTVASMAMVVVAGSLYVLMRAPAGFRRPSEPDIGRALAMHSQAGSHTNPLMVATGDKSVFFDGQRGFCLYRTIGPYLVVFADPVVREPAERDAFLAALMTFCAEMDRRPVWYQISPDWIPVLHDRGCAFFKLGEEAHVHLDRVTLDGHAGKMPRQYLRRAERDGLRFRVLRPEETAARMEELKDISDGWLVSKGLAERQFSVGFFDEDYLRRFPCAVVEEARPGGRILGFANLLEGPHRQELSVDLMRYRSGGPSVMDFLMVSLFLEGKAAGYLRFNLGMAPLASVGENRGAHLRERLAGLLFQRGEQWYQFQGLRHYKNKFDPEWVPRYLAYQGAWEWPMAIAYVSALSAGGWGRIFMSGRREQEPHPAPGLKALKE